MKLVATVIDWIRVTINSYMRYNVCFIPRKRLREYDLTEQML